MAVETDLHKTIKRIALIVVIGGFAAGIAAALIPGVPRMFAVGIPAFGLMMAGNLFVLTQRPRGWYTKRSVDTFNTVYRPLKPIKPGLEDAEPEDSGAKIDPDRLRAEIDALKRRV